MNPSDPIQRLSTFAGYFAWLATGLPVILTLIRRPDLAAPPMLLGWGVAYLVFVLVYTLELRCDESTRRNPRRLALLALESLTALSLAGFIPTPYGGILLVVIAAQLAGHVPLAATSVWITLQTVALGLLVARQWGPHDAALAGLAYFSFELFACIASYTAHRERAGREELARLNAELEATQALVADASRLAERLRISRELHDLLGHHLTALSLNLEVASHVAEGRAREPVEKSQQLTRLLLSDVRASVSELRDDAGLDLSRAVRTLVIDVPSPSIHLELPEPLRIENPAHAQTLLRCVQEIVTNCVKHSGAKNLWLEFIRNEKGLALHARDDGRGGGGAGGGNGLRIMRERLKEAGGHMQVDGAAGFKVDLWLPGAPVAGSVSG